MNLTVVFYSAVFALAVFIGCASAAIDVLVVAPKGVMG